MSVPIQNLLVEPGITVEKYDPFFDCYYTKYVPMDAFAKKDMEIDNLKKENRLLKSFINFCRGNE